MGAIGGKYVCRHGEDPVNLRGNQLCALLNELFLSAYIPVECTVATTSPTPPLQINHRCVVALPHLDWGHKPPDTAYTSASKNIPTELRTRWLMYTPKGCSRNKITFCVSVTENVWRRIQTYGRKPKKKK